MAGGSQIIINSDGIKIITAGKFEVKAAEHKFEAGQKPKIALPDIPSMPYPYVLQYLVKNKEHQIIADKPYILIDAEGNIKHGKTDKHGFMNLKSTLSAQNITTRIMMNEFEDADEESSGEAE